LPENIVTEGTIRTLSRYRILEELGRGGFATVYRALDPDLDREVALKVLDPLLTRDPVWVARFRREARAVARLDHPHVVTIYEVGQAEGLLFIATRLVEGGTLAGRIRERGPLRWDEVVRLVGEIAEALDYAHDQGVIHRDLKAANVLLDGERGALLTDFGFASIVSESSYSVSISGGVVGTPQYIAPEVWEGQPATAQTDIYALGCILYEMVTGEHLFQGDTTPSVMRAHFQPLALPETWPEGVPSGLEAVLERALAKELGNRFTRAGDLAEAVTALWEDRLAEPYAALEAAVAAGDWEQALGLAREIQAEDPEYEDVVALEEAALAGLEQAARAREAATWRQEAERALAEGDLRGAEIAVRRWQALMPDEAEAAAFLARLEERAASSVSASPLKPPLEIHPEPAIATPSEPQAQLPGPRAGRRASAEGKPWWGVPGRAWVAGGLVLMTVVVATVVVGLVLAWGGGRGGGQQAVVTNALQPTVTAVVVVEPAKPQEPTETATAVPAKTPEPSSTRLALPSATPLPSAAPSRTSMIAATEAPSATATHRISPTPRSPATTSTPAIPARRLDLSSSEPECSWGRYPSGPKTFWICNYDVSVTDLSSGNKAMIYAIRDGRIDSVVWTPDGRKVLISLCYLKQDLSQQCHLRLVNLDGSVAKDILSETRPGGRVGSAVWSPDGRKIALRYEYQNDYGVFTITSDGTGLKRVSSSAASDYPKYWSTDGEWIIVTPDGGGTLYALETNGNRRIPLSQLGRIAVYDERYFPWLVTDRLH
jgi:hypothetical protein